jgi:hypothetical protein
MAIVIPWLSIERGEGDLNPRALSSTGCLPIPIRNEIAIQRLAGLGHPRLIFA